MGIFDTIKSVGSGLWSSFKSGAKSIYDTGKQVVKGAKDILEGDVGKTINQVLDLGKKYGYDTSALKHGLRQARDITKKADTIISDVGQSAPTLFGD